MLPFYLFGNLHCIGMCGPLVMMIGKHRFKYFYFFGRILSFTLAGTLAGGAGAVLEIALKQYHIPAAASFFFGGFIFMIGLFALMGWKTPQSKWLTHKLGGASRTLSILMLKDQPLSTFLFGFFTIALPCGQTIVVYSACALSGSPLVGTINGFVFALLTSPSLFLAMNTHRFISKAKKHYNTILGVCALIVGTLALCRGFAELEIIPHWVLNPQDAPKYHIVMF
jgi:sulfite exporter TauE/SafE